MRQFGFGADQFGCLDSLWTRESNWNLGADNPSSRRYGIPQALPGSKMASAGADWATNPATQITWGLGYIQDRYGSPCGAWAHSRVARLVLTLGPSTADPARPAGLSGSSAGGSSTPRRAPRPAAPR